MGIFSNNLDEFFKVRYATVKRIAQSAKSGKKALGGVEATDLLASITEGNRFATRKCKSSRRNRGAIGAREYSLCKMKSPMHMLNF